MWPQGRDSLIMAPVLSGITTASYSPGCVAHKIQRLPHRACWNISSASLSLLRGRDEEWRGEEEEGSGWTFLDE